MFGLLDDQKCLIKIICNIGLISNIVSVINFLILIYNILLLIILEIYGQKGNY